MGLLEKASHFASDSDSAVATVAGATAAEGGIAGAVKGLRARASLFRERAPEVPAAAPASFETSKVSGETSEAAAIPAAEIAAAAPAASEAPAPGVAIRGLRQRAESMRASDGSSEIPPLPASAARGLLARARRYREATADEPPRSGDDAAFAPAAQAVPDTPDRSEVYEVEELSLDSDGADDAASVDSEGAAADSEFAADTFAASSDDPIVDAPAGPGFQAEDEDLLFAEPEPDPETADDPGPFVESAEASAEAAEGPTDRAPAAVDAADVSHLEDPLFDDLIPESHEAAAPPTSPGSEASALTGSDISGAAESSPQAASDREQLPDFDPGPVPVDDELRDFDEFLEREILTEEAIEDTSPVRGLRERAEAADAAPEAEPAAPETKGAGADESEAPAMFADEDYDAFIDPDSDLGEAARDGELPRWPYDPPGVDADPAKESRARTPGEDDDPFGLWEMDAEKEAEQQARQLELKGEPDRADGEDGMLFEVDEGFTTAPAEAHIASQKKIDHYLSLFDITKEISNISEFDELWENILYAIMGQVGAETICILSSTSRVSSGAIFYPVCHSGFELPEGWALKRGDEIYDQMAASNGVRYAEEFLNSLQNPVSPLERRILESTRAKLVVPLKNMNQMFGIVILGGQVSGDDYTIDDIEFLTLLGEIAAVGVDRVLSRIEFERDTEELRRRNMVHGSMFSLARRASGVKSLDDIYDILTRHLREDFYAESFSVVLLSPRERRYRIFAGNEISPESIEKFSLDVNSELIATISNLVRVYDLKDFRENRELAGCYTNDDLGLMQHYWIVPLINMNWLVGFITIHRTKIPWTEFHRELMVTAAEIVSSVFANCIIMSERESLFRDPFSPLEERLKEEVKKSAQFQAPVSLVDIRVKNIRRILEINPGEEVTGFLMALNRSIASSLFETDFMARVGQGRFALILPGRGRVEADIFVKKLKADFNRMRLLPGSPIDVQYSHQIISAPDDAAEAGKMLSIFE